MDSKRHPVVHNPVGQQRFHDCLSPLIFGRNCYRPLCKDVGHDQDILSPIRSSVELEEVHGHDLQGLSSDQVSRGLMDGHYGALCHLATLAMFAVFLH